MNIRSFVSIPVPNAAGLEPLLRDLSFVRGVRQSPPAQLHITLRFIGDLPEERIDEVAACVNAAVNGRGKGRVMLMGIGVFPNARSPRIVWAGVETEIPLTAIADELSRRFDQAHIPYDHKPFQPHITVARVEERPDLGPLLGKYRTTEFASFICSSVLVMKSDLSSQGASHTVLRACDL